MFNLALSGRKIQTNRQTNKQIKPQNLGWCHLPIAAVSILPATADPERPLKSGLQNSRERNTQLFPRHITRSVRPRQAPCLLWASVLSSVERLASAFPPRAEEIRKTGGDCGRSQWGLWNVVPSSASLGPVGGDPGGREEQRCGAAAPCPFPTQSSRAGTPDFPSGDDTLPKSGKTGSPAPVWLTPLISSQLTSTGEERNPPPPPRQRLPFLPELWQDPGDPKGHTFDKGRPVR